MLPWAYFGPLYLFFSLIRRLMFAWEYFDLICIFSSLVCFLFFAQLYLSLSLLREWLSLIYLLKYSLMNLAGICLNYVLWLLILLIILILSVNFCNELIDVAIEDWRLSLCRLSDTALSYFYWTVTFLLYLVILRSHWFIISMVPMYGTSIVQVILGQFNGACWF